MCGKRNEKNFLTLYPIRNVEWRKDKNVVLIVPRFQSKAGKRFCELFGVNTHFHIILDEKGSFIWMLCDGRHTIDEIGKQMKSRFGDDCEPLWPRLKKFFEILECNNLIQFMDGCTRTKPKKRLC